MPALMYRSYHASRAEDREALRQHRINWPQERRRGWLVFAARYCILPVGAVLGIVIGGLTVALILSTRTPDVRWGAIGGMVVLWVALTLFNAALYARFLWRRQAQLLDYALALETFEAERAEAAAREHDPISFPLETEPRVTLRFGPPA